MCGIAGIFNYRDGDPVDRTSMGRMLDAQRRRGPDSEGEWYSDDRSVGLGHRRLAIIDLSPSGRQPMSSANGHLVITYNGEIYNYKELRSDLERAGYQFSSVSDTEVLLHLYEEYGEKMVQRLRGMFAFAIWDYKKRGLFVARDHLGIKPLYISDDGKNIKFASQVKALLAGGGVDTTPEPAGHVGFFLWGHLPENYTLYRGISPLAAGTTLWVDGAGTRNAHQYCDVGEMYSVPNVEETKESTKGHELRSKMLDSVRKHLLADVPVGVFLSSGLDSTTIAALASEVSGSLKSVTMAFEDFRETEEDESLLAEVVAKRYGLEHRTVWLSTRDVNAELSGLFDAMDQPTVDGVNSFLVSSAAKRANVKVALSGLGADELFGGYSSFRRIPTLVSTVAPFGHLPFLGAASRIAAASILGRTTKAKLAGLLEYGGSYGGAYLLTRGLYMPWELTDVLERDMVTEGWSKLEPLLRAEKLVQKIADPQSKVSALELSFYMRNQLLRDTDWASMYHSLEVRTPFVDIELLRGVRQIYDGGIRLRKADMAACARPELPLSVLQRTKTGFAVPMDQWQLHERGSANHERGARGWAKLVYSKFGFLTVRPSRSRFGRSGAVSNPRPRSTVVIFRTGQLGDTLVALPAISSIRERHPWHTFILLTERQKVHVSSWEILGPTGWFDGVLFYNAQVKGAKKVAQLGILAKKLKSLRIDHLYNLAPDRSIRQKRSDRLFFQTLAGARNYHEPGEDRRMTEVARADMPFLEPEWRHLVKGIGGALPSQVDLPIPDAHKSKALVTAKAEGIDFSRQILAVGPGSKMPSKRWPVEKFGEVVARLLQSNADLEVVVFGGTEDRALAENLCQQWGPRSHSLAGKLSVLESAAILGKCSAYLGNDTGTMHLAAIVGIPCAAVFSARDYPGKWEPFGNSHIILRQKPPCAGCMLEVCLEHSNQCLTSISVDDVFAACRQLLERNKEKTIT